ncbi:MAG: hypothetical protein Q9198_008818, partial [Flavoplaca austrocitrina]
FLERIRSKTSACRQHAPLLLNESHHTIPKKLSSRMLRYFWSPPSPPQVVKEIAESLNASKRSPSCAMDCHLGRAKAVVGNAGGHNMEKINSPSHVYAEELAQDQGPLIFSNQLHTDKEDAKRFHAEACHHKLDVSSQSFGLASACGK